jgi:hypothetical protein
VCGTWGDAREVRRESFGVVSAHVLVHQHRHGQGLELLLHIVADIFRKSRHHRRKIVSIIDPGRLGTEGGKGLNIFVVRTSGMTASVGGM